MNHLDEETKLDRYQLHLANLHKKEFELAPARKILLKTLDLRRTSVL